MSRKLRRKPRSREELLPLPAFVVRRLSLSHHNALALLRSGHGTLEHLAALARAVYMSRLMLCAENPGATDTGPFRAAETVLHACLRREQGSGSWQLFPYEVAQLAPLLLRHDEQLETSRRTLSRRLVPGAAAAEASISPLSGSNPSPADSDFFALLVSRLTEDAGLSLV
jgi:hypothetical protein